MIVINGFIALIGRILLGLLFVLSGFGKIGDPGATAAYMTSVGLPAGLALPVGIFEVVAGFGVAFGLLTRLFAFALAAFCLLTAIIFHTNFADPLQQAEFLKNVSLAGGFLVLFAYNGVSHSFDHLRARRREALARDRTVVVEQKRVVH